MTPPTTYPVADAGRDRPIRVLAFGDSNTWGFLPVAPDDRYMRRLPATQAWPGVAQTVLGPAFEMLVDALPGRTIAAARADMAGTWVHADAFNGMKDLPVAIARHAPLDLVVVQLGANDLICDKTLTPEDATARLVAMAEIISAFRLPAPLKHMAQPLRALIVMPPPFGLQPNNPDWAKDEERRAAIAPLLAEAARRSDFQMLDGARSGALPGIDGLHFEAAAHALFGRLVAPSIQQACS